MRKSKGVSLPLSIESLNYVEQLIRKVGEIQLSSWPIKSNLVDLSVRNKSDGSLVSQVDLISSEIFERELQSCFPDDIIFSEESVNLNTDFDWQTEEKRVWIIDPLDGTKAYLDGLDQFSILVSLWTRAAGVELSWQFFPALDIFVDYRGANKKPMKVAEGKVLKSLYVRNFSADVEPSKIVAHRDSGLAFYQVASGQLDAAVVKMISHRVWDVAAIIPIIALAGGLASDEFGNELVFKGDRLVSNYFVLTRRELLNEVLMTINLSG